MNDDIYVIQGKWRQLKIVNNFCPYHKGNKKSIYNVMCDVWDC